MKHFYKMCLSEIHKIHYVHRYLVHLTCIISEFINVQVLSPYLLQRKIMC